MDASGEVEATIERIVPGGLGLAHAAGRTLFVRGAAPGDRLRARIERRQGAVDFASVVEVVEPSPERVEPPHPEATLCGGCDFQHLSYEAQLAAKAAIVTDCLRRIAKVDAPGDPPIEPSPRQWGYRARAEWRRDAERGLLGYLEQGSHRVCDVAHDPLVLPELDRALGDLRRRLVAATLPAGATGFRAAVGDDGVSIAPAPDGGEPAEIVRAVGGERYAHDADCFFQTNPGVLEPLVAEALSFAPDAADAGERPAIDLFCGVGLFTLPLARRFRRVVGVESHARSANFAARNAATAQLRGVKIEAAAVGPWLDGASRSFGRPPLVLLDPPRTGLDPRELRGVLRLRPERIAYVSCDPATLARDLKGMLAAGYRLERVAAVDMFPQTHHVEVVAHLERER
ncbi:MAG: class I SAM-dependent RNA methyltransferase [Chloroflexota bacterium]|nr:class I SAM-dependent RNA methyltransferase [Chloroflexota bacterium]